MINKEPEIDLQRICRSCMSENENMNNLFERREYLKKYNLELSEMFMACSAVQIFSGDGLPSLLCSSCESKLVTAYDFKQESEKSDEKLRDLLKSASSEVKQEYFLKDENLMATSDSECVDAFLEQGFTSDADGNVELNEIKEPSKKNGKHMCPFCHKILRTRKGLKIHQRKHTGDKLSVCKLCNAEFTKPYHLIRHMRLHESDKCKYTCADCGLNFTKAIHLASHSRIHKSEVEDVENKEVAVESEMDGVEVKMDDQAEVIEKAAEANLRDKNDKLSVHTCEICFKEMTTVAGLKIHMRIHTGKDLSSCKTCGKSFTKLSHLKRHQQIHGIVEEQSKNDKEKKVMECEFCDRKFKYKKSFSHHMQYEHGMSDDAENTEKKDDIIEPEEMKAESTCEDDVAKAENDDFSSKITKIHTCHVCHAEFTRSNYLTRHMTLHRALLIYKCNQCSEAFATQEVLDKHVKEQHVDKPYLCTICNKQFSRGEHLIRHLNSHQVASEGDDLKCSICEKTFSRSDHLARHTKIHLLQDKRHICSDCGKAFNRLDNLKTHQRIHTGIKDTSKLHLCVYCGKEFNNSSNMIVHMRRHTGERPYKCSVCSKGFPRSHDLKCHERTHSGEKPYLCTLCGKSFNKSNKLLRHTRVHTGERPYVCNICGRAFTQSNDLALHMRRHTGARPYACGICPARFIQSGQLKTHRRTTGHWMETVPDLKGGHRVEPVTPASDPIPIKFRNLKSTQESEIKPPPPPGPQKNTIQIVNVMNPLIIGTPKLIGLQTAEMDSYALSVEHYDNKLTSPGEVKFKAENIEKENQRLAETIQQEASYKTYTFQAYVEDHGASASDGKISHSSEVKFIKNKNLEKENQDLSETTFQQDAYNALQRTFTFQNYM